MGKLDIAQPLTEEESDLATVISFVLHMEQERLKTKEDDQRITIVRDSARNSC